MSYIRVSRYIFCYMRSRFKDIYNYLVEYIDAIIGY